MIALREKLEVHERLHSEFMLRTDQRTELLVAQSNEWAGVRKMLAILVALVTIFGGMIGWIFHGGFASWVKG